MCEGSALHIELLPIPESGIVVALGGFVADAFEFVEQGELAVDNIDAKNFLHDDASLLK